MKNSIDKRIAIRVSSPGRSCWICESALTEHVEVVLVEHPEYDYFFLVCGANCSQTVVAEIQKNMPSLCVQVLGEPTAFALFAVASDHRIISMSNKEYEDVRNIVRRTLFP